MDHTGQGVGLSEAVVGLLGGDVDDERVTLSQLSLGGAGSGTPMHFHGLALNALVSAPFTHNINCRTPPTINYIENFMVVCKCSPKFAPKF